VRERFHLGEEIESFFGQLWIVPSSPSPRVHGNEGFLAWVRKDLVKKKQFTLADCFPVSRADRLDSKPTHISFSRDIWGKSHQRESYAEVLRRRKMEEEKGRWVWQPDVRLPPRPARNQQFPPRPRQPPTDQGGRPPQEYNQSRQQAPPGNRN